MPGDFEINIEFSQKHPVIAISGDLTQDAREKIDQSITDVLERDGEGVVFDMQQTRYINSTGIKLLLDSISRMEQSDRFAVIARCPDRIMRILDLVGIQEHVRIRETLEEAQRETH